MILVKDRKIVLRRRSTGHCRIASVSTLYGALAGFFQLSDGQTPGVEFSQRPPRRLVQGDPARRGAESLCRPIGSTQPTLGQALGNPGMQSEALEMLPDLIER